MKFAKRWAATVIQIGECIFWTKKDERSEAVTVNRVARVKLLGPWSCRVGIVWAPGGHSGRGTSVGEE